MRPQPMCQQEAAASMELSPSSAHETNLNLKGELAVGLELEGEHIVFPVHTFKNVRGRLITCRSPGGRATTPARARAGRSRRRPRP